MTIIENTPAFRALWLSDTRTVDIAAHYGVKPPAVTRAAARFGYPKRMSGGKGNPWKKPDRERLATAEAGVPPAAKTAAVRVRRAEAEADAPVDAPADQLVARLIARGCRPGTARRIALGVVQAKTYGDLAALVAPKDGVTMQRLLPLWHGVRS